MQHSLRVMQENVGMCLRDENKRKGKNEEINFNVQCLLCYYVYNYINLHTEWALIKTHKKSLLELPHLTVPLDILSTLPVNGNKILY